MKGSRITALALVAGAGLWIASGHFLPHENAESKAAVRPPEGAAQKLFRVAVETTERVPHSQKLTLSGRTEADRKVMVTARTGGIITDLRVRRGDRVKQGDVIAVLSDEAREAQVAQARAMVNHRRSEYEAKSKLIALGNVPRLEINNIEAQLKIAEAQLAGAEAERDRGIVTAPWSGIVNDVPVELGQAAFSMAGKEIAQIIALDPILAVVEVAERKLGGIKIGDTADVRLATGQTATGAGALRLQDGEPHHAHLSGRGRGTEPEGRIPRWDHRRGRNSARPDAGDAGAAFGTDVLVGRRPRRARRRRGRQGRFPADIAGRGRAEPHVGRRHRRPHARHRAGAGFRPRGPAGGGRRGPEHAGQSSERISPCPARGAAP